MTGEITSIDRTYLFIAAQDGQSYFGHKSEIAEWANLKEGDRVEFVPVYPTPERGPRARDLKRVPPASVASTGSKSQEASING